jgi:polysaccharide pyruvyl transferase WcaK-like protein
MITVGLLFHSAKNDNLGVGALTVSEVVIIRALARMRGLDVHIIVLDSFDPRPSCVEGTDITVLSLRPMRQPWNAFRVLRQCDLVIDIGGGDSFADIYGWKRFAKMHVMKSLAHLLGKPLVLAPQTIGPFSSRMRRAIAARSIARSALVVTRDRMSTDAVRDMGVDRRVIEASDVALRLPFTPPAPRPTGNPVRIGLNVSGLLMSGGYTRANMFGLRVDYGQLMRAIIAAFRQHPDDCEIHLVPHVIGWQRGGVEDDYQASLDLAAAFPGVLVAPAFATPSEAKSYIAGLDFFMGARMHACIAAFSAGVPVVPMAYSRKFAGLFGTLGYNHTVDCTADDVETILASVLEAYERRAVLAEEARDALALGLRKLGDYETALGDLMEKVAAERGR